MYTEIQCGKTRAKYEGKVEVNDIVMIDSVIIINLKNATDFTFRVWLLIMSSFSAFGVLFSSSRMIFSGSFMISVREPWSREQCSPA